MISTFSGQLVAELNEEAKSLGSGMMSRMNRRLLMKVAKKPVFLLRDEWTVCGERSSRASGQVVYENKNGNFSQTLKLNRKKDSLTFTTKKEARDLTIEQEITFSLSEGEVQNNKLVKNVQDEKTSFYVFTNENGRRDYRLHVIRKKVS